MKAILQRYTDPLVMPGTIQFPWNHPKMDSLELPWKNNQHGISCIPAGIYTFVPFNSPEKGWIWKALNVPNRSDIEMHVANFACDCVLDGVQKHSELLGCIGIGFGIDLTVPMLLQSRNAVNYLLRVIPGKSFELEIRDPL